MKSIHIHNRRRIWVLGASLLYLVVLTMGWQSGTAIVYILSVGFSAGLIGALAFVYGQIDELKSIAEQLAKEQAPLQGDLSDGPERLTA